MSDFRGYGQKDDLLTPSLGDQQRRLENRKKPWRSSSLLYVAFFGGALAYTVMAVINGRRTELSKDKQNLIVLFGFIGLVVSFIMHYVFPVFAFNGRFVPNYHNKPITRVGDRIIGLVLYLICSSFMREADRIYQYRYRIGYASLLLPGTAAAIVFGFTQFIIIYFIMIRTGIF